MPDRLRINQTHFKETSWRDYQTRLKRAAAIKRLIKTISKYSVYSVLFFCLFIVVYGMIGGGGKTSESPYIHKKLITKKDIQHMLDSEDFVNLKNKDFKFVSGDKKFRVDTTLDMSLQQYMLKKIDRSISRYVGFVAMDPSTGKILSMVGFDKTDPTSNLCIDRRFPAASTFKIITAAAAIEKCGFNPKSKVRYNGNRYTLYKIQLKKRTNRYTNRITFRDSFAQSVDPVFGKIGALYLGGSTIKKYAESFGFNRDIGFEIPLTPSLVSLSNRPYQWAEVASGFNRETRISPVHGALIASAVVNRGRLIEPTIVDQIVDETGQTIYRSHLTPIDQAIKPRTSRTIIDLMKATIRSGTCKKAFRGYRRDKILSKLNIGGKSGSIDNRAHNAHYDWFVGFAEEKNGPKKIVISAVVAHGKYIGTRASHYARIAIKQYFRNYFAGKSGGPFKTAFMPNSLTTRPPSSRSGS